MTDGAAVAGAGGKRGDGPTEFTASGFAGFFFDFFFTSLFSFAFFSCSCVSLTSCS